MSAERFFDDLARTLAESMPRRRAVRVIGTSLAAIAVPGIAARPARSETGQAPPCNPNVETCCGRNERVCLKGYPVPINKGYCCGPAQFMWCGDRTNGYKCISICPDSRRCGQICCPQGTRCEQGRCVLNICGGVRCPSGQDCCASTRRMPKARCYDPTKQCCTPVAGVVTKWPIKELRDCPDRVAKKNHKPRANGCGPQNGIKVPDRPFVANFKPACDFHDICYETCREKKSFCDRKFRALMEDACDDQFEPESLRHIACYAAAETYYQAVSRIGAEPYEDAQKEACLCC